MKSRRSSAAKIARVSVSGRRVELLLPLRTLVVASAVVALAAAVVSIRDAFVIVFVGIFLALVFEIPVRWFERRTGWARGKSATIVVLGTAAVVTVLGLLLLVPLIGGVRDFVQSLPELVEQLRQSDELSWVGDAGGSNVQEGAENAANGIPDSISAILGLAGSAFSVAIASFTILFLALFLLVDMGRLQKAVASVLMPPEDERWLAIWERITRTVSAWAIGAATIAVIAGTVQGTTAWILGSSYALALGLIAGVLDLIPNIGATIAGCILVPTLLAEEGLTAALIMLAVVLVYQQVENNLLTPTIQGRAVSISAFLIILGVTLFGALLGPLGALVAVPVMGSLQIVVGEVTADRRARVAAAKAAVAPPSEEPAPELGAGIAQPSS
jgi:predicted PurR-regulated permease PerM